MKLALAILLLCGSVLAQPAKDEPIDWDRARQLFQRERAGEKLSPEDHAYLNRAKAQRQGNARAQNPNLTPRESTGLVPLSNGGDEKYNGFTLGLYGEGKNDPPPEHLKRALASAKEIAPLDAEGKPAADGRIAMLSIGMSNTTQEFSRFVQMANRDAAKNPKLVIVDGAQGGRAADDWAAKDRLQTWQNAEQRMESLKVTPRQVQVIWIKQARKQPAQLGEFPKHAEVLRDDLKNIVLIAEERYPNLKLIYLSSRTYGGWANGPLNPEPFAYEGGFSVQWLINSQIKGEDKELANAPPLLWGPYLWTDGTKGRTADKLVWEKADTANDGTHPSESGRAKVGQMLLEFFKSDATAKGWFTSKN